MLNRYRAAFEPSGSFSFSTAGVLGRLPASMVGLGLILFVSARGNYGLAGTLVGVQALAACVGGPMQGRLADRFGQARTLVPTALVFGVALAGLILGLRAGAPVWGLAALSVLVGASSPTTGTLARSRWSTLHRPGPALQTAFAVEAVFDEVVFVTGPVVTTVLATRTNPLVALVLAGAAGVIGSLLMAMQRRTEPPVAGHRPRRRSRRLPHAPAEAAGEVRARLPYGVLAPLVVAQLTVGTIFGSIDVVTVAEAAATGHRQFAGLILACFSFGSLVAGVAVGAVNWRMSPTRRVRLCVSVLGFTTLLLPLVPSVKLLPVAGFVIGLSVSPALVALAAAVQAVTPADRLTEAMALATASLVAGFSLGSALAGHLVDLVGPHRAFVQAACAGMIATTAVLAPAVRGRLSRAGRPRSDGDPVAGPVPVRPGSRQVPALAGPGGDLEGDRAAVAQPGSPAGDADTGARPVSRRERSAARARRVVFRVRPRRAGVFTRADGRGPGPRRTSGRARHH